MGGVLLEIVFWVCSALLVYVYAGYPLLVGLYARLAGRPVHRGVYRSTVTIVVTAYNEERGIRDKLVNLAALDYPAQLVDVIVASDASSDATDSIVAAFDPARVRLLRIEGRRGKTWCQNAAVEAAAGDIVVFTDATTRIDRGALAAMLEDFADPEVGCVAGLLVYEGKGLNLTAQGGTAYWGYEIRLRAAESALGSLVGVSGCLYAVRRSAYRPIEPELISDFMIAAQIREQGLRTVLEERAVCFEETLEHTRNELAMRIRVAIRSIHALVAEHRFLNPFRYGRFAWQLWSHKVLRYASPFLWLAALLANLLLAGRPVYLALLIVQLAVILAGISGFALHSSGTRFALLNRFYYLLLTNVASLLAGVRFLRGERVVTWKPLR